MSLGAPGASWTTPKVSPAIVRLPERGPGPGLAATAYVTAPLPVPDAAEVMLNQVGLLLLAFQVQPTPAVTARLP